MFVGKICRGKSWSAEKYRIFFSFQEDFFYQINHPLIVLQFWIFSKTLNIRDKFRKGFKRPSLHRNNTACHLLSSSDFKPKFLWRRKHFPSLWSQWLNEIVSMSRRSENYFRLTPLLDYYIILHMKSEEFKNWY